MTTTTFPAGVRNPASCLERLRNLWPSSVRRRTLWGLETCGREAGGPTPLRAPSKSPGARKTRRRGPEPRGGGRAEGSDPSFYRSGACVRPVPTSPAPRVGPPRAPRTSPVRPVTCALPRAAPDAFCGRFPRASSGPARTLREVGSGLRPADAGAPLRGTSRVGSGPSRKKRADRPEEGRREGRGFIYL